MRLLTVALGSLAIVPRLGPDVQATRPSIGCISKG